MGRKLHIVLIVALSGLSVLMLMLTFFQALDFNGNFVSDSKLYHYNQIRNGQIHSSKALKDIKPYRSTARHNKWFEKRINSSVVFQQPQSALFNNNNPVIARNSNVIQGIPAYSPIGPGLNNTSFSTFKNHFFAGLNTSSTYANHGNSGVSDAMLIAKSLTPKSNTLNIVTANLSLSESSRVSSMLPDNTPVGPDPGGDPGGYGEMIGGLSVPDGVAYLLFLLLIYIAMKMTKAMAMKKEKQ